jgi:epsilon-lactone hydrolase
MTVARILGLAAMLLLIGAGEPAAGPTFQADGTVNVPAFQLPPSPLSSPEAQAQQRARARMPVALATGQEPDIATRRAQIEAMMAPRIAAMRKLYPVTITDDRIGGVAVKIITPAGRAPVKGRVLINLHGGAFNVCWPGCGLVESIPVSALGGYRIVTVDYRMAPEHKHPAGVEDAAAVYRALLKTHRPKQVGLFGCSAGGALTAQLTAWLVTRSEPRPGAIGIFGAGAIRFESGDSNFIASAVDGSFGPPMRPGDTRPDMTRGYFAGADQEGPVLAAARHPEVMAQFPPSLIITGTRAMDMSPAIFTNSRLLAAGVESTLIVGEGMGHCYTYSADLPEARDAYGAMVTFFRKHLR